MAIKTDFDSFGTLMETTVIREVPLYQRRYSWKKAQIEALWDDLVRLYKARSSGSPIKHFIGPLILGEQRSRGLRPGVTQIIDGQQRLITLTLMITVLRDALLWDGDEFDVVTEKYLTLKHGNNQPELRLVPGRWDVDAYEEAVSAVAEFTDDESAVAKAYSWLDDLLRRGPGSEEETLEDELDAEGESDDDWAGSDDDQPGEEDESDEVDPRGLWDASILLSAITEDLELAVITDVPEERAYEIFATINATGLQLSQVDLIRNMIFVNMPNKAPSLFESLWEPMEDCLGVKGLDSYLHCWVMAEGNNVSRRNTYAAMVRLLKEADLGEESFEDVLVRIYGECGYFAFAAQPEDAEALAAFKMNNLPKGLRQALVRLHAWGSVPLQPVLFLIVKKWKQGQITAVQAQHLVEAIETLVVRRYICQIPPNDLRSSFARLAAQIAPLDGETFVEGLQSELTDASRRWPTNKEVQEACVSRPLYRKKGKQCFFILKRLAEGLEGLEVPKMVLGTSSGSWSVEHLLPQSLPTAWRNDLKAWGYKDPTGLNQEFGDTLGNLTVTAYNPDLGNLAFGAKKVKLTEKNHKLELSADFLTASEWGEREIVKRGKTLSKTVLKIWPDL